MIHLDFLCLRDWFNRVKRYGLLADVDAIDLAHLIVQAINERVDLYLDEVTRIILDAGSCECCKERVESAIWEIEQLRVLGIPRRDDGQTYEPERSGRIGILDHRERGLYGKFQAQSRDGR